MRGAVTIPGWREPDRWRVAAASSSAVGRGPIARPTGARPPDAGPTKTQGHPLR